MEIILSLWSNVIMNTSAQKRNSSVQHIYNISSEANRYKASKCKMKSENKEGAPLYVYYPWESEDQYKSNLVIVSFKQDKVNKNFLFLCAVWLHFCETLETCPH